MSVDLDAHAEDDRAADQNDLFEIGRALLGRQKPFDAMESFHDSTSRLGENGFAPHFQNPGQSYGAPRASQRAEISH
jgi:hypothetical protein